MKISNPPTTSEPGKFQSLVSVGIISHQELETAAETAVHLGVGLEKVLRYQYDIPRRKIITTLAEYYGCQWMEYDERIPIPPELLQVLDPQQLRASRWFPVLRDGSTIVIAVADPSDPVVQKEAAALFPESTFDFRVALEEDVAAFIGDFLNNPLDDIVGKERTDLAFWRNTMARWRTKLACYRTDFAKVRTYFNLLRGGLGLIGIGRTLIRTHPEPPLLPLYWIMIGIGFVGVILGLVNYFKIKRTFIRPPRHQTMVEVTAANLYFLENYRFVRQTVKDIPQKLTMLARLLEDLSRHSIDITNSRDNKDRSALAHERTSLAARRTIAACYRTMYARSRTGLSFIRTGFAFLSLGFGLVKYFGVGYLTLLDVFIIVAGFLIAIDGFIWYWPVRKEQHEINKGIEL